MIKTLIIATAMAITTQTADAASEPKKNKSVIQLSLFEELSLGNIQEKKRPKEEEKMKTKPKTEAANHIPTRESVLAAASATTLL